MPKAALVTPEQIEIWLEHPVTKAYLTSLDKCIDHLDDSLCGMNLVDSSNASLTMSQIHLVHGKKQGIDTAAGPESIMRQYDMVKEVKKDA